MAVAGPAVWSARQEREWRGTFSEQQRAVAKERPEYDARRRLVEAARRAFFVVATIRDEFFGKSGVTYNLASAAVRGW